MTRPWRVVVVVGVFVLASALLSNRAVPADTLVDTGPGESDFSHPAYALISRGDTACEPQPFCTNDFLFLAGQFTLPTGATIDTIEAWIFKLAVGSVDVVIRVDDNGLPGASIFSQTYSVAVSLGAPDWEAFSDYGAVLSPGKYWWSLEPVAGAGLLAAMPIGAPRPLGHYAFLGFNQGRSLDFDVFGLSPALGIRILGTPGPGPATVWVGLKNSDDVGTKFDLRAEVYAGGSLIGSGQVHAVPGGSSGFNNAKRNAIPVTFTVPVDVPSGTILSLKVLARITCSAPTHAWGTARLWFGDAQAASGVTATIDGTPREYFLRSGAVLSPTKGPGPKVSIDKALDSKVPCSEVGGRTFTSFGTWTITLP